MLKVADIYELYDLEKHERLLMDFDDLLVEAHRLLTENEVVREKYRSIFRHLLVDEYQDTNPVQMEILKILVNEEEDASFWACGDDWQAIYAFTEASVANILNFKDMFPGAGQMILNLKYRSTPQILRACQNLIQHNIRKIEKELRTGNSDGDDVIVLESSSEETESLAVMVLFKGENKRQRLGLPMLHVKV